LLFTGDRLVPGTSGVNFLSAHGSNRSYDAILRQELCSSIHSVTIELVNWNREHSTFQPLGIFPFQETDSDAVVVVVNLRAV